MLKPACFYTQSSVFLELGPHKGSFSICLLQFLPFFLIYVYYQYPALWEVQYWITVESLQSGHSLFFKHIQYVGDRKSNVWHLPIRRSAELLTNFIKCEKLHPWRAAWMRQTRSLVVLSLDCFLYHQEAIPRDNNLFHTHPLRNILFGDIKEPTTKNKE